MIGIGTGAIALGAGAGNWVARDPVARNAHLYFSPATGRYAKNGAPVGFSQMGTFETAGTRFEEQASGLLVPRGVDVPRLADHSTGARQWLMEGGVSKLPIKSTLAGFGDIGRYWRSSPSPARPAVGAFTAPDGVTQVTAYSIENSAIYWVSPGDAVGNNYYVASAWIRCTVSGIGETLYVRKPGSPSTDVPEDPQNYISVVLTGEWQFIEGDRFVGDSATTWNFLFENRGANGGPGTNYGLAIWGANIEPGAVATSVVEDDGSGATRAPDQFTSDLSGFDLTEDFMVYFEGSLDAVSGNNQRIFEMSAGVSGDRCLVLYDRGAGELRLILDEDGNAYVSLYIPYTLGTPLKLAAKFGIGAGKTVLAVNGTSLSGTSPALPTITDMHLGASDAMGTSKPLSLPMSKFYLKPATSETASSLEALTA